MSDYILKLELKNSYSLWKYCMLDNHYKGINIISANNYCNEYYKNYKKLKEKIEKTTNNNSNYNHENK